MSLVAYGSSDESDESDQEGVPISRGLSAGSRCQPSTNTQGVGGSKVTHVELDPPISDEDDDFMVTDQTHSGLSLPPPKNESGISEVTATEQKQLSVLEGLPKPKSSAAEVGFMDKDEGELEDFVKRKAFEVAKEQPLPTANVPIKKRKLVQITVPALLVDSDEEEENSKKQRTNNSVSLSRKKCGLFDVLPAPRNESLTKDFFKRSVPSSKIAEKEATSMETESTSQTEVSHKTKIFVPTSVSRKSKQSSQSAFNLDTGIMMPKKAPKPGRSSKVANGVGDSKEHSGKPETVSLVSGCPEDSDEDETGDSSSINFFSLNPKEDDNSKTTQEKEDLSASSFVATTSVSSLPAVTKRKDQKEAEVTVEKPEPLTFTGTAGPELQDAPLQFKHPGSSYGRSQYGESSGGGGGGGGGGVYGSNTAYNYANVNMEEEEMDNESEEMDTAAAGGGGEEDAMEGILHNKEFLKLQGKGKYGAEEINFIDVRQDDQISNVEVMKGLSEETNMMSYSKKKNKDMPSSQQKKKHQITYLAFQAKERELELKNQWADNRATKKQTQSKYGF